MVRFNWLDFIWGLLLGFYIGLFSLELLMDSKWEQTIIDHGYGYYHSKTAEFIWIGEKE